MVALLSARPPGDRPRQPSEAADRPDVWGPAIGHRPVTTSEPPTDDDFGGPGPLQAAAGNLPGSCRTGHLPSPTEKHPGCREPTQQGESFSFPSANHNHCSLYQVICQSDCWLIRFRMRDNNFQVFILTRGWTRWFLWLVLDKCLINKSSCWS